MLQRGRFTHFCALAAGSAPGGGFFLAGGKHTVPKYLTHIFARRIAGNLYRCTSPHSAWSEELTWEGICALTEVECARTSHVTDDPIVKVDVLNTSRGEGELDQVTYHVRRTRSLAEMVRPSMAQHKHIQWIEVTEGMRVEAGQGDEYDTGTVHRIDGLSATVGWDSGVTTTAPLTVLRTTTKLHRDGHRIK